MSMLQLVSRSHDSFSFQLLHVLILFPRRKTNPQCTVTRYRELASTLISNGNGWKDVDESRPRPSRVSVELRNLLERESLVIFRLEFATNE